MHRSPKFPSEDNIVVECSKEMTTKYVILNRRLNIDECNP